MTSNQQIPRQSQPLAIVGLGAIMPEAPTAAAFWDNITRGRYCITDVPKDRWDPELYYDPDPRAMDKTYSRLGGWVREFPWDPIGWHLPLPPKVSDQMDDGQKWAVSAARAALTDAGWPNWKVDPERVAVVIGNAIGGEKHYETNLRIQLPEFTRELARSRAFAALPSATREAIMAETTRSYLSNFSEITEDTMPGELANIISSRIAHLFNFRGPSFTTDAACASGLAGISAAAQGLASGQYDAVVTGGVDRNMGVAAFVKFCKIGALSATGSRPFDAGADGFVMGEGAALFVLKRLADAERDGDWIYAVLLGVGGSSDGRGKGITAPNPVGQRLAIARAWQNAGADLATASCIEAHGTSTRVGDAAELESLTSVLPEGIAPGSIALGSVKSNIGHLKGAAGPAGLLKLVMSLNEKVLPPSLNFAEPNPNVDWAASPFQVNTELRDWSAPPGGVRRGGVSAFGFGGTNFHAVVEEYIPGRYRDDSQRTFAGAEIGQARVTGAAASAGATAPGAHQPGPGLPQASHAADIPQASHPQDARAAQDTRPAQDAPLAVKEPLRGALVVGGDSEAEVAARLAKAAELAAAGQVPPRRPPDPALAKAKARVAIDYGDAAELADKSARAVQALTGGAPQLRKMLRARGVFIGHGPAPKIAFLYTGQGSQYVNMLARLRETEPIVAQTFAEADEVMTPLLGKPLTSYIFIDLSDPAAIGQLEQQLLQTEITQPAVLAADIALTRMLAAYGIRPDMVMGHSLGEYGALVAAGSLSFQAALEAVSARGQEMAHLKVADNGAMAAVMAPLEEIERIVASIDGYVVTANINSTRQAVIGGATRAVERAIDAFTAAGHNATRIPVSHAFHTSVVAPVSEPLRRTLARLKLRPPALPIVANVDGNFYPGTGPGVTERMLDILGRQVASPVQFVAGLRTLYGAGARVFVEVGPKRALASFAEDVLGEEHNDVLTLFTNHPKTGDIPSFNIALCGLYAAGFGYPAAAQAPSLTVPAPAPAQASAPAHLPVTSTAVAPSVHVPEFTAQGAPMSNDRYAELGRVVAELFHHGSQLLASSGQFPGLLARPGTQPGEQASSSQEPPGLAEPAVITGAALGLPGRGRVFDEENVARILAGEQLIDVIPRQTRREMVDKHITRLVKSENGDPVFETIESEADVIKLAGRYGSFDMVAEFGIDAERDAALDPCTRLAIGVGLDALRDAGIPLVHHYRTTTLGTKLPDRWALPHELGDDTGVVFASAFPGYDSFLDDLNHYHTDRARRHELATLEDVRSRMGADSPAAAEVDRRIGELRHLLETQPFVFNRRFLFRALAMGHSQFAEFIGARGPNTQINAACASTAQALSLAQDWIADGRCRRAVIISADDAASDNLLPWTGAGFLATGAAATDDVVEDAALPFDRRRHGMIIGSGAAGLVVESAAAARERGISPICEILSTVTANSAFHGTRLDVEHIGQVMERLIRQAERYGIDRQQIAGETVFVSHETYTPARGGSASAEINALRKVFGPAAESIVIANTKGFTGHAMAAGVEEVVAVKTLETGLVPPVPNFREIDPELGSLNLSRGGAYPVTYALRLAAGFGSQIAMALLRWVTPPDGRRHAPSELGFGYRVADAGKWRSWLARMSGRDDARLEIVQRKLRVADDGAVQAPAAAAESATRPAPTQAAPIAAPVAAPVPVATSVPAAMPAPVSAAPAEVQAVPAAPQPATAPAPPAAAAEQAAVPTAQAAPQGEDPVAAAVLDIVERLTGYPRDLLDPDLDLEADLGVDTVKQAEVFAAVREQFAIPRDDNLKLRDFPTLRHVIGFVRDRAELPGPSAGPVSAQAPTAQAAPPAPTAQAAPPALTAQAAPQGEDPVAAAVLDIVERLTGYPRDLLDPDLDLEADLGVDTVKQAEVFAAVREQFAIPRDDNLKLRDFPTLRHVIGFVRDRAGLLEPAGAPAPGAPAPGTPAADATPARTAPVSPRLETTGPAAMEPGTSATASSGPATTAPAGPGPAAEIPALEPAVSPDGDPATAAVLDIVERLTGYPRDLLDPDLDLEADLGVDTVKQAEVFAAVREQFAIPRDDNLKLRDFPTLRHVIGFVRDRAARGLGTAVAPAVQQKTSTAGSSARTSAAPAFTADISAAERLPRRIPVPVLRPPAGWCKKTGVTLDAGSRIIVMADEGGVADSLVRRLEALGATTLLLEPGCASAELETRLASWLSDGPVQGTYWLAALDTEPAIGTLDLAGWREQLRRRVKDLYTLVRGLDTAGQLGPRGTFLVAATRLGGYHGYDDAGAVAPLGGAVTGFVKAYRRERPEVLAKAVDFPVSRKTAALADALIEETLIDPGAVEIGRASDRRWAVGLREVAFGDGGGMTLGSDTVFAVTGAAGAIVSAIVADLAKASGGIFHLLDLTPEPDPADPDLARFVTDRDGLKAAITERLAASGKRPTPVLIERELARYERLHSALIAIESVREAGGQAYYHAVDLTDPVAVSDVVADIRQRHGRVDVLLHAAGLDISHAIADKGEREYSLVFDVKSDGWFNLLHAAADLPIGATVAFSSVAGRFGNAGQTDYSAANDLLCKIVSSFRTARPDTRAIAIDWTAWGGLGMATRGSIPKIMAMAGIEMLDPAAGIGWIRRELTAGPFSGEVVVGGQLGVLMAELDDTGGLDTSAVSTSGSGPMTGTVTGMGVYSGLTVETVLDPTAQPFLNDHRIDSTPVLPGVMGVEAFAELAGLAAPGMRVADIEQMDFLAPVKFYRDQPRTLTLAAIVTASQAGLIADCTLRATRTLKGDDSSRTTTHFTGKVRLIAGDLAPERDETPTKRAGVIANHEDIYHAFFHGPAYQVIDEAWRSNGCAVAQVATALPAENTPESVHTTIEPRLAEACFQTAGLWEIGQAGRYALPAHADLITVLHRPQRGEPLFAVVHPASRGGFDCRVVDSHGDVVVRIDGYQTAPVPNVLPEEVQRPIHDAMTG